MKKSFKLVLSIVLTFAMTIPLWGNTFASAETISVDDILISNGFQQFELELWDQEYKEEIALNIAEDPNSVPHAYTVTEINELDSIEDFVNTPDEVYLAAGIEQSEIDAIHAMVNGWRNSTDQELMSRYDRSQEEIKMLRLACEPSDDYSTKTFDSTVVTTSGSIASSQLAFSITAPRATSGGKFYHSVKNTFNWYSLPFVDILTDEIANAWGGDMYTTDESSSLTYYYHNNYTGNGNTKVYSAHYVEGPINGGFRFWTHQSQGTPAPLGNSYHQLWKGTCSVRLNQNGPIQGKTTKILGQYGHHTIGWASVTISKSPSISFGTGWDYSEQVRININY